LGWRVLKRRSQCAGGHKKDSSESIFQHYKTNVGKCGKIPEILFTKITNVRYLIIVHIDESEEYIEGIL
jgi:hypothetical protein